MGGLGFILYSVFGIIAGYICHHLKMGYVIEKMFKVKKDAEIQLHEEKPNDASVNQVELNKFDTIHFTFSNMFLDLRETIWRVVCCKMNGP